MMKLGDMGKISSGNAYTALDLNDDEEGEDSEETEKTDLVCEQQEIREICSSPSILKKNGRVRPGDKIVRKVGVTTPHHTKTHVIISNNSVEDGQPKPRARQQHSLFGDPEKGEAVSAQLDVEAVKLEHGR